MKHSVVTSVAVATIVLASCSGHGRNLGPVSSVDLTVMVGNTDVTAVEFEVACDSGFALQGNLNVIDDRTPPVWATVMDLPVGDCTVTLIARDDAGEVLCTASRDVTVVEDETTKVELVLTCLVDGQDPTGNVDVDATFEVIEGNTCPRLHFLNVVPDNIPEGGSAAVTVFASDADGDPVTTALTATSGSFADPAAQSTTYTCDAGGTQTVSVTASDGDAACDKVKTFDVTCTAGAGPSCVTIPNCELVWSDEFDGDEVDPTKWEFQLGDGSQFGIPGWGNNEKQWYTANNATVANGVLTIQAREESIATYDYTSTRIRSLGRGDWTYGRFEMRARLPETQGMWPAFWLLSSDPSFYGQWAASGEIDIMESLGHDPELISGTIHFGDTAPGNQFLVSSTRLPAGTATDFHVYAVEWKAGQIRWYVDGALYGQQFGWFSTGGVYPAPFDVDFHLLLNLAVGGTLPGDPDATTVFPQDYVIDYVRVYQQALGGTPGATVLVDDMEHGNPFANDWFIFDGASTSGSITPNNTDLPPGGGALSLGAAFGPGSGFLGGFGKATPVDLTGTVEFSFWINPDAGQSYVLEINLQDDDNGDGAFTQGVDDEYQFNCAVSPTGPCAIAGGGWQQVTIPLNHFYDDSTFSNGGNGILDANGGSEGLITAVVMAITGATNGANFRTDDWFFRGPVP